MRSRTAAALVLAAVVGIAACSPFVWVYDASSSLAGIVTEASYHLQNLKGGMYYVLVSTNPDCQWTVDFAPK